MTGHRYSYARLLLVACLIAAALLGVALAIVLNRASTLAETAASRALGRQVSIAGGLEIDWALTPRVRLRQVRVANPDWARRDRLLTVAALSARIDLPALLAGQIRLDDVRVRDARINLERTADGRTSWPMGSSGEGGNGGTLPTVRSSRLQGADVYYTAPGVGQPLHVHVASAQATMDATTGELSLKATGSRPRGREFHIDGTLTLAGDAKHPFNVAATLGDQRLSANGRLGDSRELAGMAADLTVEGESLAGVLPAAWRDLAHWPSYRAHFRLKRSGPEWVAEGIDFTLGESDASGTVRVSIPESGPSVHADLESRKVDLVQLLGNGERGSGPIHIPRAPGYVDIDLRWRATTLYAPGVMLRTVDARGSLHDGELQVDPFAFKLAGGQGRIMLALATRKSPPHARIDVNMDAIDLRKALSRLNVKREGFGRIKGHLSLDGNGETLEALLGATNGDFAFIMRDGRIDQALVRMARADVRSLLGDLSKRDAVVPLRCTIADARIREGMARFKRLVVDTDSTRIVGRGRFDLAEGTIDLQLQPRNKDFSLISGQPPIHIGGTLFDPTVSVDKTATVASLLTPIELGAGQDANCAELARAARENLEMDQ